VLCRFGWHGGQLHFEAGQGLAPTLDELPQHGKLRRRTVTVRSIQRPRTAAPVRPGRYPPKAASLHFAQPLQRGVSNKP
jgi:hypothetical protein